jgi:hypothetical protein
VFCQVDGPALSDGELHELENLVRLYCDTELDQFDHWSLPTPPAGRAYVELSVNPPSSAWLDEQVSSGQLRLHDWSSTPVGGRVDGVVQVLSDADRMRLVVLLQRYCVHHLDQTEYWGSSDGWFFVAIGRTPLAGDEAQYGALDHWLG